MAHNDRSGDHLFERRLTLYAPETDAPHPFFASIGDVRFDADSQVSCQCKLEGPLRSTTIRFSSTDAIGAMMFCAFHIHVELKELYRGWRLTDMAGRPYRPVWQKEAEE